MARTSLAVNTDPEVLHTTVATFSLAGALEGELAAGAAAGFDGIEFCASDLMASTLAPEQARARCADLGLSSDVYRPFRDLDATNASRFTANPRRAQAKLNIVTAQEI